MAERRAIVSYDELYDDTEEQPATGTEHRRTTEEEEEEEEEEIDDVGSAMANPDAWDDSELIRAWDGAIGSYRKHHAKILDDSIYLEQRTAHESAIGAWLPIASDTGGSTTTHTTNNVARHSSDLVGSGCKRKRTTETDDSPPDVGVGPEPPVSEQDAMHKLTTAWYYAGYYAGYYEAMYRSGKQSTEAKDAETEDE
ncbi:hypothetical protein EV175_000276 [Coemansia sp. RSA 1933]|nr:hypothetical protein EV175_000276 [Coemansia sp. RSA 1933]